MYQAMARRYRPETFDQVIGQEHVAQTLKNAIATDRVAHAYLFCGPHGCGKTSMARIMAKALVCARGPTAEPCNQCELCRSVMRGQDVDVLEIDGASNTGVDNVRRLREGAAYVPNRARYKIYIIDEVHMLTLQAFNALLKILEEPPAHVKFILATTDPHRLPDTVVSRCQRFDFRLVPPPALAAFLKQVVAREKAGITDEAVDAVAAFGNGSVRDSLVLLDQLLNFGQGRVTRADVEQVRGVAGAESVSGLYRAMLGRDAVAALALVDEVASRGVNVGDFLDQLIAYGRDLMLLLVTGKDEGVSAYGPAREALRELASGLRLDSVLLMLDVLVQARIQVRGRALSNPLVPLEMAVARLCSLDCLASMGDILRRLEALGRGAPPVPPPPASSAGGTSPPVPAAVDGASTGRPGEDAVPGERARRIATPSVPPAAASDGEEAAGEEAAGEDPRPSPPGAAGKAGGLSLAEVQAAWPKILKEVESVHAPDLVYLQNAQPTAVEGDELVVAPRAGGFFLAEQLDDDKRRERLRHAVGRVLDREVRVRIRRPGGGRMTSAQPSAREPAAKTGRRVSPQQRRREEAESDPVVRDVLELFGARIASVDVDEQ